MDLLLKEESVAVYIKFLNSIVSVTVRPARVKSMGIKYNFNIKGKKIKGKKFLLWHK